MYKAGTNIVAVDVMSCLPIQENLQVSTPRRIIHLMDHLDDTIVDSAYTIFTDMLQGIQFFQRSTKL